MMERRKTRWAIALMLSMALTMGMFQGGLAGRAYAAQVDTSRDCSVTFGLDTSAVGYETAQKDLMDAMQGAGGLKLNIRLYKTADAQPDGKYVLDANFQSVKELEGIANIGTGTTAADWEKMASAAAANISGAAENAAISSEFGYADFLSGAKISGLKPGIYLVSVRPLDYNDDRYEFVPYLMAVPGWGDGGEYDYDIQSGLKPMKSGRPGELVIRKYLPECRVENSGSTFVFEIKAERNGEVVYNDVQSVVFTEHGMKEVKISGIPSGSQVTVTEVYSGSSYMARAAVQTAVITADAAATVEFYNDYNDNAPRNGASAVNHMTVSKKDGNMVLNWEKLSASRPVN